MQGASDVYSAPSHHEKNTSFWYAQYLFLFIKYVSQTH